MPLLLHIVYMTEFNKALYEIIGEGIKKIRVNKNINQTKLSDNVHIGRSSISNIEKGNQQPPLHVLYKICSYLDIDIHSILPTLAEVEKKKEENKKKGKSNELDTYLSGVNNEKLKQTISEIISQSHEL